MRELHYANGSIVVSFDLCTAIFDYALALAHASTSDLIHVPIVVDGEPAESNILLGPASQLFCTPSTEAEIDLNDKHVITDIRERINSLAHEKSVPSSAGIVESIGDFDV
jgi:hypothetical protein